MKPSGLTARKNSRSAFDSANPAQPKIAARGSRTEDDAGDMTLLERPAQLRRGAAIGERSSLDAINHAAAAFDTHRIGRQRREQIGFRALQARPFGLRGCS